MKFYKTIRFKLTLIYTVITFCISFFFIIFINAYFVNYVNNLTPKNLNDPSIEQLTFKTRSDAIPDPNELDKLAEVEFNRIRDLRNQDLERLRTFSVVLLFPIILTSFLSGYYISGKFLNPLKRLNLEFQSLDINDSSNQLEVPEVEDEIAELIKNYNQMIDRIQNSFQLQKQFIEDASHQLKTPLAVLNANLESLVDIEDAKSKKRYVNNSLEVIESLNQMIEKLLILSKENNPYLEEYKLHEIKELIENLSKAKLDLDSGFDIDQKVAIDKHLFIEVVTNLIENQNQYSEDLNSNEVLISQNKNEIEIEFKNSGKESLNKDRIFQRFYREGSQNSIRSKNFGLGLPIAKKIIKSFNGELEYSFKNEIHVFSITLPIV